MYYESREEKIPQGKAKETSKEKQLLVIFSKHSDCLTFNWFLHLNRILTFPCQSFISVKIIRETSLTTCENSIWIIIRRYNYFISFLLPLLHLKREKQTILTQKVKKQTAFYPNWSALWTREITLSFIQVQICLKLSFCFPSLHSAAA